MKKFLSFLLVCIVVIAGVSGYFYMQYTNAIHSPFVNGSTIDVQLTIEKGTSVQGIAKILRDELIIEKEWPFLWYVKLNNLAPKLQAGNYTFSPGITTPEIIDILSGKVKNFDKITIPEGYTSTQIDELLTEKNLINSGDFLECLETCDFSEFSFLPTDREKPLEGYLFPNTYFIETQQFTPKSFISQLLTTFDTTIDPYKQDITTSKYSLDEIVNMAAMIERESRVDEERPLISGILWKRIDEGIALGVDATSRYELNKWTEPLTYQDLRKDTPYNTRIYRGLPPTPISNPGAKSLEAAIYPEQSPYYFYLHGLDGQIRYGRTNAEHNINKQKYL